VCRLLPLIDLEYRTAHSRAIIGWSFGGLAADLRRDVPKEIVLQPYRRAVEEAQQASNEGGPQS